MQAISWYSKYLQDLSSNELYEIVRLRHDVFILEQENLVVEFDGELDKSSLHIFALSGDGTVPAYARIVAPGMKSDCAVIGRVVTSRDIRGKGFGVKLMEQCLIACEENFSGKTVELSAQSYPISFYQKFGFTPVGEEYEEDNIPHIKMINKG